MMIFVICKCYQFNIINKSQKELNADLKDSGPMGIKESDHPDFDYVRNAECGCCGSKVYFKSNLKKLQIAIIDALQEYGLKLEEAEECFQLIYDKKLK